MALIEQIQQMQNQGMSQQDIVKTLQEQNFTPVQIDEAYSQLKVKGAVKNEKALTQQADTPSPNSEMQPSISTQSSTTPENPQPQTLPPMPPQQTQTTPQQPPQQMQQPMQEQAYPPQQMQQPMQEQAYDQQAYPQEQYPQNAQGYDQYGYDQYGYDQQAYPQEQYYQQALDIETIRDVAKQITEENLTTIKTKITDIEKIKSDLKFQVQNIDNRLTKIEQTIQDLQTSIIKKIGNYGETINEISDELKATQDSFGKLVNPILDNKRKTQSNMNPETKTPEKPKTKTRESKPSSGFEDYFR